LEHVPQRRFPLYKVIGYSVTALVLLFFIYLAYIGDWGRLMTLAIWWFLANGICAAVAVALVRGHPLSVLAAFCAAPITSLNPSVGAGWVAGAVEAKFNTPTVADMKELGRMETWEAFWGNRAVKVLMVAAFGNLGSTIGTMLFFAYLPALMDIPLF
jgi:pheromone shutdown protein TraB